MRFELIDIQNKENKSMGETLNTFCTLVLCGVGCVKPDPDYLCTNPGVGCRNGCGGATGSACAGTTSIGSQF